jgi:SanA protein
VNKIIISADTLNKILENEVELIKADLLQIGINEPDLIIDNNGNNTFNSVRHLKKFAGKKITIVSQKFHLERALYIADNLNIKAVGYIAAGEPTPFMHLREIFARFKMQIILIIN